MEAFQAICDAGSCTNAESDVNQLSWVFWPGTAEQTTVLCVEAGVCPCFVPILAKGNILLFTRISFQGKWIWAPPDVFFFFGENSVLPCLFCLVFLGCLSASISDSDLIPPSAPPPRRFGHCSQNNGCQLILFLPQVGAVTHRDCLHFN